MGIDMASTDAPFGLLPYGRIISAKIYSIVTAVGTNICVGDLMEHATTAYATPHYGTLTGALMEETGAAGSLLGACLATFTYKMDPCLYIASGEAGNSTIAGYALIADSAEQVYIVAEDGDTSSITAAGLGLNVDMIATHAAAAANNYRSKMELDSSTINTTATLGLKIIGMHPDDTVSSAGAAGNHARFIVKLNTAFMGNGVVGV